MKKSTPTTRCLGFTALVFAITLTATAEAEAGRRGKSKTAGGLQVPKADVAREMPVRDVYMLRTGFQLAFQTVREVPTCGALFAGLTFNGPTALALSNYTGPRHPAEQALCDRGVHAVTCAGQLEVRICPALRRLTREGVAAILIHEALHTAGLNEYPEDPQGPTSPEITRAVLKACALG